MKRPAASIARRPRATPSATLARCGDTLDELRGGLEALDVSSRDAARVRESLVAALDVARATLAEARGAVEEMQASTRRDADKRLRELERAVAARERAGQDFITNAAHELRTPLAAIVAAVEVLERGAKEIPEERDHFLRHVARQSARLSRLAQALLVLARAQGGDVPPVEIVPLASLLAALVSAARPAEGVDVTVECPPDLAVLASAALVEQALSAVVENAVRYTSNGSIAVRARRSGSRRVVIEVVDTGIGIPRETRERVFDRFFRTPSDGDADSFGLGLSIARQAVHALHGEIALESEPGVGTAVRVTLPAARLR